MVGKLSCVLAGLVAVPGLQRFSDLGVEPHPSAIGKPFAEGLLDHGMAELIYVPLSWDFLNQMGIQSFIYHLQQLSLAGSFGQ